MCSKKYVQTKPYKQIVVDVFPEFAKRLQVSKIGPWKRGVTSNLNVSGYMAFLFELNEYLPKQHKLTDAQLARLWLNEFPNSIPFKRLWDVINGRLKIKTRQDSVQYYRGRYNSGVLFNGKPRKGPISFRYGRNGERISIHSHREIPIKEKELQVMYAKYGPDTRDVQEFNWTVQEVVPVRKPRGITTYKSFDWCI